VEILSGEGEWFQRQRKRRDEMAFITILARGRRK